MAQQKDSLNDFLGLCLSTKDKKVLSSLLDLFFTSEEKENLKLRYMIIKELLRGEKTQRQIAKDLNVSIAKITRGSNELKRIEPALLKFLRKKLLGK